MKKIYSVLILGTLLSANTFAQDNGASNLHIQPEKSAKIVEKISPEDAEKQVYVPNKAIEKTDDVKSDVTNKDEKITQQEQETLKDEVPLAPSFILKKDFVSDGKSISALSDIEKVSSVLGQKNLTWFNPLPNDKNFSMVFKPLTLEDSQKIVKDDDNEEAYKDYRFALVSFYYQNKKQGEQLSILLPSQYEHAVRIQKYGSDENSINADILIDQRGRVVSILGPNEAIYLNKRELVPVQESTEKAPNMIFY